MLRLLTSLIAAIAGVLMMPGSGAAAGFDCDKAASPDENAVCRSAALSALDSEMTGLWYGYSRVPMLMGANGERQDAASAFLVRRRQCRASTTCLTQVYNDRIAELRHAMAGSMTNIEPFVTAGAGGANSAFPSAVASAGADYAALCSKAGGSLSNPGKLQVLAGDIDDDGQFDYVANPAALECRGAATALCANDGCEIRLYMSRGGYASATTVLGGQPTLVQRDGKTEARIWVSRFNCDGAAPGTPCWAVYSWDSGKLSSRYQINPDGG